MDKYGRTAGSPGCLGIGQHLEQEMLDKGGAIKLETSGNEEEIVPELDVSLKKMKIGEPDFTPGGASS